MSLEQIVQEQFAIRTQIVELQERLLANDKRIEQLTAGNGMGSRAQPSPAPSAGFEPPPRRNLTYGAPSAPAAPAAFGGSPSAGRSYVGGSLTMARPPQLSSVRDQKVSIERVNERLPDTDAWEQPKDSKKSPATVDRCEVLLRQAFEHYMQAKPTRASNPIAALQNLLRTLDKNQSGKVDKQEFQRLVDVLGFTANPTVLDGLFHRYDLDNSGYIENTEFGRLLLKPEGDSGAKAKSAIARMREVLSYRAGGFPHLLAMGKQFRIIDRDRNGQLSKEEFNNAMDTFFSYYKIKFTVAEKNALFSFFDKDTAGTVSYDEYLRAVRGEMDGYREDLVRQAFNILDKDGSGVISTAEVSGTYDVSQNPEVKSGKTSRSQAYSVFMEHYDLNKDGQITWEEFLESYQWVSASIDDDDYFELMMRNAWHISGGEGVCENTANRRVLVEHSDGACEVVEIKNDLGLDVGNVRDVLNRLQAQGVKDIKQFKLTS